MTEGPVGGRPKAGGALAEPLKKYYFPWGQLRLEYEELKAGAWRESIGHLGAYAYHG